VTGLLTAVIVFGTVLVAELPDNSGLASLVLSTRYRAGGVLAGAVLVLRADSDDDDAVRLKADAAGFWSVAATSFGVILLAELGDLSDIVIANLSAKYHDPVAVGIGSVLALWSVVVLAIVGGRGLQRILPLRWIARLAALIMLVMAGFTLVEALR
jgi:putative Ca2+/H+ antiporter (TMEM165/GDT1 family)